jgi:hypothetical protein
MAFDAGAGGTVIAGRARLLPISPYISARTVRPLDAAASGIESPVRFEHEL